MDKIDKSKPYGCELCKTAFELPILLKNHMNTHAELLKFKCQFCEASFLCKQYLIYHERTHSSMRPFECKICQKTFISRNKWIEHKRLHTGETPFQCAFCDESFSTANLLRNHQAENHTVHHKEYGHHPYQCNEFDKRFQLESTLFNHKKLYNFEHKDHGSEYSGKTKQANKYARGRNINLQRHKRKTNLSNRKQLPKCSICGMTFNSQVTLRKHEVCHYQGETFKCNKCDKHFRSPSALSAHRKTHLDQLFECHICHQHFNSRNNLDSHLFCHPSDKPYGCQFCSMSFKLAVELKVHLRSHSNERPFRCSLCPMTYQKYNHLAQHIKIKHPESENNLLELSSDETFSTAESDSSATEIYMIQSEVEDIDTVSEESSSLKTSTQKLNEEKAPIAFLFRGRLEGQKSVEKNTETDKGKKVQAHQHLEQKQFIDQVELWDQGLSQNAYGPERRNGRFTGTEINNTSSYGNPEKSDTYQNHTNQTGTYTSTNSSEPVRQQMMDLPKLSNYGDTDNLLSWPSPLQITLFEHFDSTSENEFSEGSGLTEEKTLLTGRKLPKTNKKCFPFVAHNGGETADNKEITHKMQISPALNNQQKIEGGGIPEIVMNNLPVNGGQQFEDILDDILGDTSNENIGVSDDRTKLDIISNDNISLAPVIEDGNKLKQKTNFVFGNKGHLNKNVECYNAARYIVNDNFSNKCECDRRTIEDADRPSETCNRKSINHISNEKVQHVQSEIMKETTKDFLKISRDTFKSKKGQWIETSDPNIKFKKNDRHVREGQYIKVDRKISFFVTKTSSVNESAGTSGDLDSVDSEIADCTTVEGNGTIIMCSDNDSVRSCHNSSLNDASTISDFDDDAEWDSYSADESIVDDSVALDTSTDEALNTSENISTPNISAEDSNTESDTETTTDYDNDENPMTDNCSSQDTDDEINFDHQKEHTIHCIKKKTRWLKRNFKFKKSMFGSKHCVSYAVYNKNYSDFTKLIFRRCASEIEKKYGENKYMTEEKIAKIREMIKKKHFARPAYTSDVSSVEASEKSVKMHNDEKVPFTQQEFRITSPRYKTRYTLKKIHEKHAHHNFNIPVCGTTVVKSNVNVQYNKISSPRYKTRYAKLKLTKENVQIKCHVDKKPETSFCEMNNDQCIGNKTLRLVNEKSNLIHDEKPKSKKNNNTKSKCNGFPRTGRDCLDASQSSFGKEIRRPKEKRRKLETEEIKSQPDIKNMQGDTSDTVVNHILMTFKLGTKRKKRNGSGKCFEKKINKLQENVKNKILNANYKSAKIGTDCESDENRTNSTEMLNSRNTRTDNDRKRKSDNLIAKSNDVTYLNGIDDKETSCKDENLSFCTNYIMERSHDEIVQDHGSKTGHLKDEDDNIKNNKLMRPKLETQYMVTQKVKNEHGNVSQDTFTIKDEIDKLREKSDSLAVKCKTQQNIQLEYSEKIHHQGSEMERNRSDTTLQCQESNDRARCIKDQKDVNIQSSRRRLTLYDKYQAITHWSSLGYFKKKKKDVDKDVPFLILRGYKTSGPDVVVPPFENTRLKCKEREGTNKEPCERSSLNGLNNIQEYNVHTNRSSVKASKRSSKQQRGPKMKKQKRKKDIRAFSNGFMPSTESTRNIKDGEIMKKCERSFMEVLNECRNNSTADTTPHSTTLYDIDPKRAQCNSSLKQNSSKESSTLLDMPEIQTLPKVTKYGIVQEQTRVNESSHLQKTGVQKEHGGIKPDVGKKLRRTMEEVVKSLMENNLAKTTAQTLRKCNNVSMNWKEICDNQPIVKLKRIDK